MQSGTSPEELKNYVRQVYGHLVADGSTNLGRAPVAVGKELASTLGYEITGFGIPEEAWALFAGCGNPLAGVSLEPEWIIVDVGCGVGIDSQLASRSLRPPGRVIGLDFTEELLRLARGYATGQPEPLCSWVTADGEHLPIRPASVNLVIANGSFNLMPCKRLALSELHRILLPGGHLALADLVRVADPEPVSEEYRDAWAWCVAGALSPEEYDLLLDEAGFSWWRLQSSHSVGPYAIGHLLARKDRSLSSP